MADLMSLAAVGEALGDTRQGARTDLQPLPRKVEVSAQDATRFRLMAAHRDLWWPVLAEDPSALPLNILMDECRSVYESRNEIVAGATIDEAREGLRRAMAIEQYVTLKGHKDEARRAARVLETAVGEALGEAQWGGDRRSDQPARAPVETAIDERDRHRFRLMATHRDLWWPVLAEKALSRNQVLTMIAETVEAATAQEITGRTARVILADCMDIIADLHVDLLIADPPYFTDGDFTRHVSACLKRVKPTGQAYIFASADPAEVAAYIAVDPGPMVLSQMLVWNYNNTGQRQPNDRYTSNYQMIFYYRGAGAPAPPGFTRRCGAAVFRGPVAPAERHPCPGALST